jgi:hypothetical protein
MRVSFSCCVLKRSWSNEMTVDGGTVGSVQRDQICFRQSCVSLQLLYMFPRSFLYGLAKQF